MSRTVNGVSSLIAATRWICRIVGRFGTVAFAQATTPEMATAVGALVAACQIWESLDDNPGERDRTPDPDAPEDAIGI